MNNNVKILLALSTLLLLSCSKNIFLGEWKILSSPYNVDWEFSEDSLFIISNNYVRARCYNIENNIIMENDSSGFFFEPNGRDYIIWNFKPYNGDALDRSNPLDEVCYISKDVRKDIKDIRNNKKDILEIIVNGVGDYYVDIHIEGQKKEKSIKVKPNSLSKTEAVISPKEYILNQYFFTNEETGEKLPFFYYSEELEDDIPENKLMIKVYGINQMGTKRIEKHFKQKVEGEVLMFRVDTLENLLTTFKSTDIF